MPVRRATASTNGWFLVSDRRDRNTEPLEVVYGLHPVLELLDNRAREVDRIFVAKERVRGLGRALRVARGAGIPVSHLPREVLVRKIGRRAVHQGIAAQVTPVAYADVDELCRQAADRPDAALVLVDQVVDPRNLGAMVRTAAAAGAEGLILGGEGTVGLTPAVAKTSAGALERIPVARDQRPAQRLATLKKAGFRVIALEPRALSRWSDVELTGRVIFVAGGEGQGLRRSVREACDDSISIPLERGVESLNVAVALGVLLFESVRQKNIAGRQP